MFFFKKKLDDDWKMKAKERRKENVKLSKEYKELQKSRDNWKSKAEILKEKNKELENELKKNS